MITYEMAATNAKVGLIRDPEDGELNIGVTLEALRDVPILGDICHIIHYVLKEEDEIRFISALMESLRRVQEARAKNLQIGDQVIDELSRIQAKSKD